MNRAIRLVCFTIATSAFAAGCHSAEATQPRTALADQSALPPPSTAGQPATTTKGSVSVDDAIAKACNLPTPEFPFDSARIEGDAARSLDAITRCFVNGPLAGKSLRLIGHADPRGQEEYNFGLGQRRAGSVASFVESHGLSSSRIATSSRGAQDATGTDEAGWARDRRVDVVLAN
jgi:peptidoglycan-associated lipoprotein